MFNDLVKWLDVMGRENSIWCDPSCCDAGRCRTYASFACKVTNSLHLKGSFRMQFLATSREKSSKYSESVQTEMISLFRLARPKSIKVEKEENVEKRRCQPTRTVEPKTA